MPALTVIARIQAKPGREEDVKHALLALVEPTHAEDACINYDLHQTVDEPGVFFFHENWASPEMLEEHLQKPHLQDFVAKAEKEDFLAAPLDIWKMCRISKPKE